jgi:V/A-type H+-transporting ATPase subunit E
MGHRELIASLQKEAEEKMLSLRNGTEEEIEKIREETSEKIKQIRAEFKKKQAETIRDREEHCLYEASRKARMMLLSAEKSLGDRLFSLAHSQLHELRDEKYRDTFDTLFRELPPKQWDEVKVNPEDAGLAKEYFPHAGIEKVSTIVGGFEVTTEKGKFHITNTFHKRLERAFQDLLPLVMRDIYNEVLRHGTPSKA